MSDIKIQNIVSARDIASATFRKIHAQDYSRFLTLSTLPWASM